MGIRSWIKAIGNKNEDSLILQVEWVSMSGFPESDFLFIRVSEGDLLSALESWMWLPLNELTIISVSAFGEVFFRNDSNQIFRIDTIEGKLDKVADSLPELIKKLQEENARDDLLLAGFVVRARERGLVLDDGECYDFKIAPILGGPMNGEHIEKTSFVVKLNIAGQIHEQIKELPPGTEIDQITITD